MRVKKFEWLDPINKNGTLVFNDEGELQTTFGNGKWNVIDHSTIKLTFGKIGEHTMIASE